MKYFLIFSFLFIFLFLFFCEFEYGSKKGRNTLEEVKNKLYSEYRINTDTISTEELNNIFFKKEGYSPYLGNKLEEHSLSYAIANKKGDCSMLSFLYAYLFEDFIDTIFMYKDHISLSVLGEEIELTELGKKYSSKYFLEKYGRRYNISLENLYGILLRDEAYFLDIEGKDEAAVLKLLEALKYINIGEIHAYLGDFFLKKDLSKAEKHFFSTFTSDFYNDSPSFYNKVFKLITYLNNDSSLIRKKDILLSKIQQIIPDGDKKSMLIYEIIYKTEGYSAFKKFIQKNQPISNDLIYEYCSRAVKNNDKSCLSLLEDLHKKEYYKATEILGVLHLNGIIVEKNYKKAMTYLNLIDENRKNEFLKIYEKNENFENAGRTSLNTPNVGRTSLNRK